IVGKTKTEPYRPGPGAADTVGRGRAFLGRCSVAERLDLVAAKGAEPGRGHIAPIASLEVEHQLTGVGGPAEIVEGVEHHEPQWAWTRLHRRRRRDLVRLAEP